MSEHKTLAEALVAAQEEMPAVERDGTNPHFRSSFTTLGHLLAKARPVLNKHGLSIVQLPSRGEDGSPTLRTTILHTSGERIEADAPLFLPKNDPQGQGSAITYLRRYSLASALGISDQEDDDGNSASGKQMETPAAPTAEAMLEKVKESGLDHFALTNWLLNNGIEVKRIKTDEEALAAIKRTDPTTRMRLAAAALAFKAEQEEKAAA